MPPSGFSQKAINGLLEFVEANMPATKERDEIILFVKGSSRGIMKGYFPE